MEVSAWKNGSGTYGIKVGDDNRDKFFNPSWDWIDVEIEGNIHRFQLTPGFWNDCSEFRDSGATIIHDWLLRQNVIPWQKGKPPKFRLELIDERQFRLGNEMTVEQ
ncbi:MAG: hypothetical protein LBT11_03465 [Treponema sp.]|jgi:hypothetical protein|nr:hypothetical protein [Treponema sp.]